MDYPPDIAELLALVPENELGPGKPREEHRTKLAALSPHNLSPSGKIADGDMAAACLAGLWLRFEFLEESHHISQDIHNSTGSFWHGIMHRREPDYDNAKYWFHRVGDHAIYEPLRVAAAELAAAAPVDSAAAFLTTQMSWDPIRFIDLVTAAARGKSTSETLCRQIQLREWELLFEFCWRRAVA